jgi:SSS family solute:Na+ symporter
MWGPKVLGEPLGIPAVVVGMLANIIVFLVVHVVTRKKTPAGAYVPEEAN